MAAKDDKAAKAKAKEREAKTKAKEREAKRKEKEKAAAAKAKAEQKAKDQRAKDQAAAKKEKEREAKAKAKQREAREKEKAREAKAKDKRDAERAAHAKEKEREAKAKAKQREAREKEKAREAKAKDKARAQREARRPAPAERPTEQVASDEAVQAVEEVAVPERGETTEVPAEVREEAAAEPVSGLPELPELDVPDNDKTVRPKGYLAETLGREDAVDRSTQRATIAASYTTRDHDLIRAWASTRGGRPADVKGTAGRRRGPGTAGVLRIEFPDGPGDDGRLEDIDWAPFFETFDSSDVDFLYQERVRTGDVSRFHKFVRASA